MLSDERKMAKYSKTAEFKRIEVFCKERIEFYQKFLPNGAAVGTDVAPTAEDWRVANRIIAEFNGLLDSYNLANEVVKEVNQDGRQL